MLLKNKNIIFKIRRSKVTDYAALTLTTYCVRSKTVVLLLIHCLLVAPIVCVGFVFGPCFDR